MRVEIPRNQKRIQMKKRGFDEEEEAMELCVGRRIGSGGNRARIREEDASFFTEFHHED